MTIGRSQCRCRIATRQDQRLVRIQFEPTRRQVLQPVQVIINPAEK